MIPFERKGANTNSSKYKKKKKKRSLAFPVISARSLASFLCSRGLWIFQTRARALAHLNEEKWISGKSGKKHAPYETAIYIKTRRIDSSRVEIRSLADADHSAVYMYTQLGSITLITIRISRSTFPFDLRRSIMRVRCYDFIRPFALSLSLLGAGNHNCY